jgi:hypothetical protein
MAADFLKGRKDTVFLQFHLLFEGFPYGHRPSQRLRPLEISMSFLRMSCLLIKFSEGSIQKVIIIQGTVLLQFM